LLSALFLITQILRKAHFYGHNRFKI